MEARESTMTNDFIDPKEAAKMLTITTKQLHYIMETDETVPKPIFLSKRIKRWKKEDVSGWLDSKTPK